MNCPDCGSRLTSSDLTAPHNPTASLTSAVRRADEDEVIGISTWCGDCGWTETRRVRLEEIDTEHGDQDRIEQIRVRNKITNQLDQVQSIESLEDVLTEVKQRAEREEH